ncbi:MAG: response regulator [Cyanobacteria bacterium P01_G01_bin.19]
MIQQSEKPLLIIEDSDEDFAALTILISKAQIHSPVYRCDDGESALDFLHRQGEYENPALSPRPSLIVLDLNLPGTDGREVLADLKHDPQLKTIPVVIFTTSSNPRDIQGCYLQGVNGYMVKPMNTKRLERLVQVFLDYWFEAVELP